MLGNSFQSQNPRLFCYLYQKCHSVRDFLFFVMEKLLKIAFPVVDMSPNVIHSLFISVGATKSSCRGIKELHVAPGALLIKQSVLNEHETKAAVFQARSHVGIF